MALCHYLSKITAAHINICIRKQLPHIERKLNPSMILHTANTLAFLIDQSEDWLLIRSEEY